MSTKQVILNTGKKFSAEKNGRFAKDIIFPGKWIHPSTKRDVVVDPERVTRLQKNTTDYLAAGNKIPFRDGHKNSVLATMGEWTGPFIEDNGALVGVVEPKLQKAKEGLASGAINTISAVIEFDITDSKGNHYDEVITAIDATDFPVVTGQSDFIALSRDAEGNDVFFPEALAKADPDNDGDVHAQHDELHDDLKDKVADFSKKKGKLGADHADTKAAGTKAQEAAMRLRKQANVIHDHVQNMTGGAMYMDHTPLSTQEALQELARPVDPDLVSIELAKASGKVNPDGTFKGGFDGCVVHMTGQGYSTESAKKICGKINAMKNG